MGAVLHAAHFLGFSVSWAYLVHVHESACDAMTVQGALCLFGAQHGGKHGFFMKTATNHMIVTLGYNQAPSSQKVSKRNPSLAGTLEKREQQKKTAAVPCQRRVYPGNAGRVMLAGVRLVKSMPPVTVPFKQHYNSGKTRLRKRAVR